MVWNVVGDDIVGNEYEFWEEFGSSVSLSGDGRILAVGQPQVNDNEGSATVYRNEDNQWLRIGSPIGEFRMGWTVSLSRTSDDLRIAINGARWDSNPGQIQVFELSNCCSTWLQIGQSLLDHDLGSVGVRWELYY
jgi:hypothetical protein